MIRAQSRFCAVAVVTVLAASNLYAATYVVNNTSDTGSGSLRQAILNANAHGGGTITFFKVHGTITLHTPLPAIAHNTYILGPGKNALTISGNNQHSILSLNSGTASVVSELTIANGSAAGNPGPFSSPIKASGIINLGQLGLIDCVIRNCTNDFSDGAAIYNSGSLEMISCLVANSGSDGPNADVEGGAIFNSGHLRMDGCTLSNCVATRGGGIFNTGGLLLNFCAIKSCFNDFNEGDGGGIYHLSGNLTLNGCTVSHCEGGFAGGAVASLANVTMTDTTITGNNALEGGGLYLGGGTNFIRNCTISGNEEFGLGGGGLKTLNFLTMIDCTVSGNSSFEGSGAGIENLKFLGMTNCTVSGNTCSTPDGGAIFNTARDWDDTQFTGTALEITDCTIVSNKAAGANGVGGIKNDGGVVYSQSSIVAENLATDISGPFNSLGHNLIQNTSGAAMAGDFTGNIYGKNPLVGPLRNNGGSTFTHALLAGSPAINAGPVSGAPRFDQRGMPRPEGAAEDIGAFELGNPQSHTLSLTRTQNALQIDLNGPPASGYIVQRASSPNGPWTTITNVATGADGNGNCIDPNPPAGRAYYRSVFPGH